MLIEIKGVQFVNKGAELMLHAIIEKIKVLWPDAQYCLVPDSNSPYLSRAKVGAFQKLNFRKNVVDLNGIFYLLPKLIRNYFKNKWGIVTEADVDMILDASGFKYGDQWSTTILKQVGIEASRFNRKNKHYVFMPQALGPFSSSNNQKAAKKAFEAASIVFAREKESLNFAISCTSNGNIIQAPDFTNLLLPESITISSELKGGVAIIPNSKMLGSKNSNLEWKKNYIKIILYIINTAIDRGEYVFLLNHEGIEDKAICQQINSLLAQPLKIIEPDSSLEVKAIITHSKAIFCSRYHGCVSALSNGVPCIATSWSHKYEQLFLEYEVSQLLIPATIDKQSANNLINYVIDEREKIKNILLPNISKFKQNSKNMWEHIYNTVTPNLK